MAQPKIIPSLLTLTEDIFFLKLWKWIESDLKRNRGMDPNIRTFFQENFIDESIDRIMNRITRLCVYNSQNRDLALCGVETLISQHTMKLRVNNFTVSYTPYILKTLQEHCRDVGSLDLIAVQMLTHDRAINLEIKNRFISLTTGLKKLRILVLGQRNRLVNAKIISLILDNCPIVSFIDYAQMGNAIRKVRKEQPLALTDIRDVETTSPQIEFIFRRCPLLIRIIINQPKLKTLSHFYGRRNLADVRLNSYNKAHWNWNEKEGWDRHLNFFHAKTDFSDLF